MPERFKHIFFVNSGSEANDTIVRFVRHYWKLKGKPYRKHFIGRQRGLSRLDHGRGEPRRHGRHA